MDNMRILKGYSEDEQKELENAKRHMSCNDLLLIITGNRATAEYCFIKGKYYKVKEDEQISIIRDILDFYCGDAKFPEQKYYVHFIKDNRYSYLTITPDGVLGLGSCLEIGSWKTKFTREEIIAMNPQFLPFMEEVEE